MSAITYQEIYQAIKDYSYLSDKAHKMLNTEDQVKRAFERMKSNSMPAEKAKELILYIWGVNNEQPDLI